jgi:hypothetical protein
MAFAILFSCRCLVVHISPTITGELKQSPPTELHEGGRHTYDRVLPDAPKGSFMTLLPPPQCHATFGMMRYTLARWARALFAILWHNPSLWQGSVGLEFGWGHENISVGAYWDYIIVPGWKLSGWLNDTECKVEGYTEDLVKKAIFNCIAFCTLSRHN